MSTEKKTNAFQYGGALCVLMAVAMFMGIAFHSPEVEAEGPRFKSGLITLNTVRKDTVYYFEDHHANVVCYSWGASTPWSCTKVGTGHTIFF